MSCGNIRAGPRSTFILIINLLIIYASSFFPQVVVKRENSFHLNDSPKLKDNQSIHYYIRVRKADSHMSESLKSVDLWISALKLTRYFTN